jgi:hypothetical protein
MKQLAAAAISAALFAGLSGVAFAQTAAPAPAAPTPSAPLAAAPAAASPAQPSHAAMVAHPKLMHRVAHDSDRAGDPGTRALNLLEANGYTDIKQFRQVGADYQATVTRQGKPVTVTVDPGTGRIQTSA